MNPLKYFSIHLGRGSTVAPDRGVNINGLRLSPTPLCMNTLFTGIIGSGKTSCGMLPALTALLYPPHPLGFDVAGGLILERGPSMSPVIKAFSESRQRKANFLCIAPGEGSVRFNLINPAAGPAQAAREAWSLVSAQWNAEGLRAAEIDIQGRRFLHHCIQGLRLIRPTEEVMASDLCRLTSDSALDAMAARLQQFGSSCDQATMPGLPDWHSVNDKALVYSAVKDAFTPFIVDQKLSEQFCSPSNFDFRDCAEKNLLISYYSGHEYAMVGGLIGLAIKQRFQSMASERLADFAANRRLPPLVFVIDEAQCFLDGHSDPEWLANTEPMRVICFAATQSEAWLRAHLGSPKADLLLKRFTNRIWFTNTDIETNNNASDLCGRRPQEKGAHTDPKPSEATEVVRYASHDFLHLGLQESIAYSSWTGQRVRQANKPVPLLSRP